MTYFKIRILTVIKNDIIYISEIHRNPQYLDRFDRPVITFAQRKIIHFLKEEGKTLLAMYLEVIWNGPNADALKDYLYTGKTESIPMDNKPHSYIEDIANMTFSQLPPIMEIAGAVCDQTLLVRFLTLETIYAVLSVNRESVIVDVSTDGFNINYSLRDGKRDTEKTLSMLSIIEGRAEITFKETIKL